MLCPEPLLTDLDVNFPLLQGSPGPCWVQPVLPAGACPALWALSGRCGAAAAGTGALPAAARVFTRAPGPFPSVTFPLDLTKTRLQIQGEAAVLRGGAAGGQALPYRGMLRTAAGIAQEEGVRKLWQGATPAVYRHIGDYLLLVRRDGSCLPCPSLLE